MAELEIAGAFNEWVDAAIEIGLAKLSEGEEYPLALIYHDSGEFDESTLGQGALPHILDDEELNSCREIIAGASEGEFYALIWDSAAVGEDDEVVYIEAGTRDGRAIVFSHHYKINKSGKYTKSGDLMAHSGVAALWPYSPEAEASSTVPDTNPDKYLDDLALQATEVAVKRMRKGMKTPFLYQIDHQNRRSIFEMQAGPGDDEDTILRAGRVYVEDLDQLQSFVLVHFDEIYIEDDGWGVIVAECEQRNGRAQLFVRRYVVDQAGNVGRIGNIRLLSELGNRWPKSKPGVRIRKTNERPRQRPASPEADQADSELADWLMNTMNFAFEFYADGDLRPCVMIGQESGQRDAYYLEEDDDDYIEDRILIKGREHISGLTKGKFYALMYAATVADDNGEPLPIIYAEFGNRHGRGLLMGHRFKTLKSGKVQKVEGLLAVKPILNLWGQSVVDDEVAEPGPYDDFDPDEDECELLPGLADFALELAEQRLLGGKKLPFLVEIDFNEDRRVVELQNRQGNDPWDLQEFGRVYAAKQDHLQAYALVYLEEHLEENQWRGLIVADCEERDGDAFRFFRRYIADYSGNLMKIGTMKPISPIEHLWDSSFE